MPQPFVVIFGKAVRYITRLRGGGSALPGLFVERISPDFIKNTLATLPKGVVVISGTNGKTTTTKIVVALLEAHGLKVFTNRTGSNFTRGVAAALLGEIDMKGHLDADIAVLELDEAHAVKFVQTIPPRYSLLLNVMRDQLDRFGEIDATAKLLESIATATTGTVVLNREDRRILAIKDRLKDQKVEYFGLSDKLLATFPSDDDMRNDNVSKSKRPHANVILKDYKDDHATFELGGHDFDTTLRLNGVYNVFNSAAAIALTHAILDTDIKADAVLSTLATVTPAFGRGEALEVGGQPLELVLVKNPSGFRLGLKSFSPAGYATMIAINDNYADGRDMSWLWDVDFESLHKDGVAQVSGIRAYDMALRLQYDEVTMTHIEPELALGLRQFIENNADSPKRIYCTYTAMLALRKELSKITTVEVIS
ncbi:MAG: UDP-N-acetylmuramyl tripeptide synthase [Candidatus Saccharibacteria bacterium]|nr:UDP-N-acetylmuramyl tripeptide synthase [Candidatus Saccharibacteria bacterium]